jgi:hypothetical protein
VRKSQSVEKDGGQMSIPASEARRLLEEQAKSRKPKKEKPPQITEKVWQSQVIGLAKTLGWRVYHPFLSKWSEKGYPDLTLLHVRQKRVVFAELKRQDGKETPAQREWLDDLHAAGQEAYLWRPSDWEHIAKILQQKPPTA